MLDLYSDFVHLDTLITLAIYFERLLSVFTCAIYLRYICLGTYAEYLLRVFTLGALFRYVPWILPLITRCVQAECDILIFNLDAYLVYIRHH